MSQVSVYGLSWQGPISELAQIVQRIQRLRAFGRLSLRNLERMGIAHFYFRAGKLVHIVGSRGNAQTTLLDVQEWRKATLRFDRGVTTPEVTVNEEYEQLLDSIILNMQQRGVVRAQPVPPMPRVVESRLAASSEGKQLISPAEWRLLVEGTRRVSLAVAQLVGPREALKVLQDILDDCATTFPAFASLKISSNGYLQVIERSALDHLSRHELLEGFAALIAICQHFCTPIIGERKAHKLIIQALQEMGPALTGLGVFHVDSRLLGNEK